MANSSYICDLFDELDADRYAVLRRAKDCALHTLPTLLPEEWFTDRDDVRDRFSSFASRGVMNIANRLTSLVVPTNGLRPFQHELVPLSLEQLPPEQQEQLRVRVENLDQQIAKRLLQSNFRAQMLVASQHIVVIGDACLEIGDKGTYFLHRLDNYVVRRDLEGRVYEAIIRKWVDVNTLADDLKSLPASNAYTARSGGEFANKPGQDRDAIFYHLRKTDTGWTCEAEFRKTKLAQPYSGSYKTSPYVFMGYHLVTGENYHRSYVEDLKADLRTDECLSRALVQGALLNAWCVPLVNPDGSTQLQDLNEGRLFEWRPGRAQDISIAQLGSQVQLQATSEARREHRRELGNAFLMASSIQRSGDRVTATEMRIMAEELQQAFGGPATTLSENLAQIIARLKEIMVRDGEIPEALNDEKHISVKIRTGLEALGREVDANQLLEFAALVGQTPAAQIIKWREWAWDLALARGLNVKRLVPSLEEQQAAAQQAQQQQLQSAIAAKAVDTVGNIAEESASQKTK